METDAMYACMKQYCLNRDCCDLCPVHTKNKNHNCGRGQSYTVGNGEVSLHELRKNYGIVFGGNEMSEITKDAINPSHYKQGGIECIDALKAATINLKGIDAVCTANAIKYLWRWKEKNGLEDLNKAIWYINRLIKENTHE